MLGRHSIKPGNIKLSKNRNPPIPASTVVEKMGLMT